MSLPDCGAPHEHIPPSNLVLYQCRFLSTHVVPPPQAIVMAATATHHTLPILVHCNALPAYRNAAVSFAHHSLGCATVETLWSVTHLTATASMTAEPTADRRGVASHWKMAGLVAGGLAVGYALVQERERVAGAIVNVQDTLTNNGLTLMQKLSEMADAFLAKVHESFVAAAPPTNLEAAVRHGLTGQSDDAVTTPVPRERPRAPRTRLRENDTNTDDENADDSAYQPEASHRRRRTRHSGPEQSVTPSQHCSSRAAGAAARSGWQASLRAQEEGDDDPMTVEQQSTTVPSRDESEVMDATAVSPLPEAKEKDATRPAATVAVGGAVGAHVAFDKLASAQTTTIAQRAQTEPASLLGARLSATWHVLRGSSWVKETCPCEVMMIRKGEEGDKFEALVKYEMDGFEEWVVIGEPPRKHTLIAESAEMWLRTGSALIDAHTLECIDSREFEGVVMAWLPKRDGHKSLYKIYHVADGDFEELDDTEVTAAIALFTESANDAITKE